GDEAVRRLHDAFAKQSPTFVRMHGLWVLERLGRLDDALLKHAATDDDAGVRVHAMKVLSERPRLEGALRDLVLKALNDADAFVQRAAADALGQHPAPGNLSPLLELRHKVPEDDTHLAHVVRMALRNHLRRPEIVAQLPADLSERDSRALADVAPGVSSEQAA